MATIGEARAMNLATKAMRGTYRYSGMTRSQSKKVGTALVKEQVEVSKRSAYGK